MVKSSSKEACQQAGCCYDNTREVPCYYGNTGTTSHPKHATLDPGRGSLPSTQMNCLACSLREPSSQVHTDTLSQEEYLPQGMVRLLLRDPDLQISNICIR